MQQIPNRSALPGRLGLADLEHEAGIGDVSRQRT